MIPEDESSDLGDPLTFTQAPLAGQSFYLI